MDPDELLRLGASVEATSEHPLAAAVVAGAEERGEKTEPAHEFRSFAGHGVSATVLGHRVYVGRRKLMDDNHQRFSEHIEAAATLQHGSDTAGSSGIAQSGDCGGHHGLFFGERRSELSQTAPFRPAESGPSVPTRSTNDESASG